ncbi:MAG TPA: hypothetical protein VEQ40_11155 [Pyrinomonadaceae bacterium]|nr:hypothetical protein [Pyrinomonadaceae bacterium]
MRRERRAKRIEPIEPGARLRLTLRIGATVLLFSVLLALIVIVYRQRHSSTGIYRKEYEGRVIDKSETFVETREGSFVSRRLLIEDRDGVRFEVAVSREDYGRVQKGMWIKKNRDGIELSWP